MSNRVGPITPSNLTSQAGSIFIDNTSFSGTDIQVYAHLYDPASAAIYRYKALQNEITQAQNQLATEQSRLSALRAKLESVHSGTPEEASILNQINKQVEKVRSMDVAIDGMNADLKGTEVHLLIGAVLPLGTLQTLSISTSRDKRDVRALGHVGPKGRTRGPRSLAGTAVFTVFNQHSLYEIMHLHASEFDGMKFTPALADQMPPVDFTIVFANEYGHISRMAIYGIDFANEGMVFSIQDILTEQQLSFFAYDIDPLRSVAQRRIDENYRLANEWTGVSGSMLMFEEDYRNMKNELDPFHRFQQRQNPYV